MKKELLDKLKKINPLNEEGVPKNQGNCQWCAIEAARVLLEGVEPREIPNFEEGLEPIEERIHPKYGSESIHEEDPENFFKELRKLNEGELMLVSLESDDLDHAYIIYRDENKDFYLIDPDRQVFVELDERDDFLQAVKGWDGVEEVNYLNGDIDSDFRDEVSVDVCVLNSNALEEDPLPEYGSEPPERAFGL
ncbi:hypothetical protein [Legionella israelensis]|uniref:Uncharacterized protein n=1 Tax=Legionella israelensis TaxID=454 RepID=A0A0W0WE20_9GAMM|nr:hypothetical protein [Legionella israelensis]KTD30494.1 hypothetical protein Lisr_0756 [Legionella israelensis]QBS09131.1 hypothetical protein E4T55_04250 [Legionella israelensis]SCY24930.1 hypothetical protein SAMN02746069_01783 [Legionella israelensis DSM 19235]STX58860.1 Uncharacterised protein [Legionella israelensis]